MRVDLPNGTVHFSQETYQEKIDALLEELGREFAATDVDPIVVTWFCIVALLMVFGLSGHEDIADDLRKMFNKTLAWPKETRNKEKRTADNKAATKVIDKVLGNYKATDDPEALYIALTVLGNYVLHMVAQIWGEKVGLRVKENLEAVGNQTVYKAVPPALEGLN
jgi:hypothetical protein